MKLNSIPKLCLILSLTSASFSAFSAEKNIDTIYKELGELPGNLTPQQRGQIGFTTHLHTSFILVDMSIADRTPFLEETAKVLLTIEASNNVPQPNLTPEFAFAKLKTMLNKQHNGYWDKALKLRDAYNKVLTHYGDARSKLQTDPTGVLQMMMGVNSLVDRKHLLMMDGFVNKRM